MLVFAGLCFFQTLVTCVSFLKEKLSDIADLPNYDRASALPLRRPCAASNRTV